LLVPLHKQGYKRGSSNCSISKHMRQIWSDGGITSGGGVGGGGRGVGGGEGSGKCERGGRGEEDGEEGRDIVISSDSFELSINSNIIIYIIVKF